MVRFVWRRVKTVIAPNLGADHAHIYWATGLKLIEKTVKKPVFRLLVVFFIWGVIWRLCLKIEQPFS